MGWDAMNKEPIAVKLVFGPYKKGDGNWKETIMMIEGLVVLIPQAAQGLWLWGLQQGLHTDLETHVMHLITKARAWSQYARV